MLGGTIVEDVATKKTAATQVFEDATFTLHEWHSNEETLEKDEKPHPTNDKLSFAKQQLGSDQLGTKLLGLVWEKKDA